MLGAKRVWQQGLKFAAQICSTNALYAIFLQVNPDNQALCNIL
jgi:hypothetical protein